MHYVKSEHTGNETIIKSNYIKINGYYIREYYSEYLKIQLI